MDIKPTRIELFKMEIKRRWDDFMRHKKRNARIFLWGLLYRGCKHTHTFRIYMKDLPIEQAWYHKGEKMGKHDGIYIEGCYLCGRMWMKDYKA